MKLKLKNVGDALRVVYDVNRKMVSIPINAEVTVDLHERLADKLTEASLNGDTLHVQEAPNRVRPEPPKKPDAPPPTPAEILAKVDELDYHSLLSLTKQALPDADLGPRPTKAAMVNALRGSPVKAPKTTKKAKVQTQ
jgi:hypothetical protein